MVRFTKCDCALRYQLGVEQPFNLIRKLAYLQLQGIVDITSAITIFYY